LTGCAALPDMSPYRDATVQLRSAVVAGGNAVQSGLDSAAASYEAGDPTAKQIKEQSARFSAEWRARIEGADALLAYSEAVTDIARSATEGAASARSLADALTQLATGVGIVLPPAGTVATVTDAAAFVYGHIAAARAANSLDQALQSAQPVVDRVATVLSQDLQDSLVILRAAHDLQLTAITEKYRSERGYLNALNRERKALYVKGTLTTADEQRLRQIGELYEATREWREPMDKALATADDNLKARIQLIQATQAAVAEWAAAHRSIAAAVKEKRTVNVEALVQATLEAQELVRRLRAL
jgi:hypothetical protein